MDLYFFPLSCNKCRTKYTSEKEILLLFENFCNAIHSFIHSFPRNVFFFKQVPANETCILEVQGLESNESYIFAVAAYSSDGKLIGDSIGETTKPILAYPPLSIDTVRAYLIQVAYSII